MSGGEIQELAAFKRKQRDDLREKMQQEKEFRKKQAEEIQKRESHKQEVWQRAQEWSNPNGSTMEEHLQKLGDELQNDQQSYNDYLDKMTKKRCVTAAQDGSCLTLFV